MGYYRKNPNRENEDMEFPAVLKKQMSKFQGSIKEEVELFWNSPMASKNLINT